MSAINNHRIVDNGFQNFESILSDGATVVLDVVEKLISLGSVEHYQEGISAEYYAFVIRSLCVNATADAGNDRILLEAIYGLAYKSR